MKLFFISHDSIRNVSNPSPNRRYDDLFDTFTESLNLHIHAYIVATHALFERFFENLALSMMEESKKYYDRKGKVNVFLTKLIAIEKIAGTEIGKNDLNKNIQDAIAVMLNQKRDSAKKQNYKVSLEKIIENAMKIFENYINNNNSIINKNKTAVYDRLCLLGIDPVDDIQLNQQFRDFAKERGDFAHQGVIKGITPSKAQTYIDNMLEIAKDVKNQAKALMTTLA